MYAKPFSAYGQGEEKIWDGISPQSYFGYEAEMILQRGGSYTIRKIEKSGGTIYIDFDMHPKMDMNLLSKGDQNG